MPDDCDVFIGLLPVDENNLYVHLEGNTEGWLAVGFSETESMVRNIILACS